jgi:hypothetical protein
VTPENILVEQWHAVTKRALLMIFLLINIELIDSILEHYWIICIPFMTIGY